VYDHPGLEFAENNIEIRCRFYNTTTTEVPDEENPDYNYTVAAGQLKFDFVVHKWEWNIDKINQFLKRQRHRNTSKQDRISIMGKHGFYKN
jgi:hypothetical protein